MKKWKVKKINKKDYIKDYTKDCIIAVLLGLLAIVMLLGLGLYRETIKVNSEKISHLARIDNLTSQVASAQAKLLIKAESTLPLCGEYIGDFFATAYCCEKRPHICGGGDGITASGKTVTEGVTVAVDPNIIPLGTWLYIDEIGIRQAQDTGGAIKGNKIDVAVDTHQNALNWAGYGTHRVYILKTEE
ncbi:MAG: 3D domain-containing protein [Oscillospiraceae bacterium]